MGNYSLSGMNRIAGENEVAVILSNYNSRFIYDVIQEKLANIFRFSIVSARPVNIVQSFDINFKNMKATYPSDLANIEEVERETYKEIVELICTHYGIEYSLEGVDPTYYFTIANYLYEFLVCCFFEYVCEFYARYIHSHVDAIYDSMGLERFKKNKDSSTTYSRKMYEDPKVSIIAANIIFVVNNMKTFDITVQDILDTIYGTGSPIANTLSNIICNVPYDFFKVRYTVPQEVEPLFYTNIRLSLQILFNAGKAVGPQQTV